MTDTELDAIMRIMDSAFDPQWGEAWTRNQVSSALMLSNTHATLIAASGEDLRDPAEARGAGRRGNPAHCGQSASPPQGTGRQADCKPGGGCAAARRGTAIP